jgi:hypothetical protein
MKLITSSALLLILFSHQLSSQNLITDRPDQTESSSTVMRGSVQIETGFLFDENFIGNNPYKTISFPSTLFRIGISDKVELRVQSGYQTIRDGSEPFIQKGGGFADLEAGFKVQLFKEESNSTKAALLSHIGIPSGSHIFSGDEIYSFTKFAISHDIGTKAGIGYNIGFGYSKSAGLSFLGSFVYGISVTDRLGLFSEVYGSIGGGIDQDYIINYDNGLTYLITDFLQADLSFGTGINSKMNFISTGISWNIH